MSHIYKRKGSAHYYVCYKDNSGKLVRHSTKTTDAIRAEQMLMEIEAELLLQRQRDLKQASEQQTEPSQGDITQRLEELESTVRRLFIIQSFEVQMAAHWGRTVQSLMPSKWRTAETKFFDESEEERQDG